MIWELEFQRDRHAIEKFFRLRKPLPRKMMDFVESEPDLGPFDNFYLAAFRRLATERKGGPCIPYSAIRSYALERGLDSDSAEIFEDVIWHLDEAHMKWVHAEAEKSRASKNG